MDKFIFSQVLPSHQFVEGLYLSNKNSFKNMQEASIELKPHGFHFLLH